MTTVPNSPRKSVISKGVSLQTSRVQSPKRKSKFKTKKSKAGRTSSKFKEAMRRIR